MSLEGLLCFFKAGREFALKDEYLKNENYDIISDASWKFFSKINGDKAAVTERLAFRLGEYSVPRYAFSETSKKVDYAIKILKEEMRAFPNSEVCKYFKAGRLAGDVNAPEQKLDEYIHNFQEGESTRLEGTALLAGLYSRPRVLFFVCKDYLSNFRNSHRG